MVAEFFDPLVTLISAGIGQVVQFRDRFELGVHSFLFSLKG